MKFLKFDHLVLMIGLILFSSCGYIIEQVSKTDLASSADVQGPVVTMVNPVGATLSSSTSFTFSWTATDQGVGLAVTDTYQVTLYLGAGCTGASSATTTQTGSSWLPTLSDGVSYSIQIIARDGAGNSSTPVCSDAVTINTAIPATPTVVLQDPSDNNAVNTDETPVSLLVTADTSAVAWFVTEQAAAAAAPAAPAASATGWVTTRPTTLALGAQGLRRVYVYTKSATGLVSTAAGTATINYTPISSFSITGITSATDDVVLDSWLSDGLVPRINWADATGETSYELTMFAADQTTVVCAMTSRPLNTTNYTWTGCNLTDGSSYWLKVSAIGAGVIYRDATNSLYFLTVKANGSLAGVSNLVVAYHFNEGAGVTAQDISSNAITLNLDTAAWTTGHTGSALHCNSSLDTEGYGYYVPALELRTDFSVEAWVQSSGGDGVWMNKGIWGVASWSGVFNPFGNGYDHYGDYQWQAGHWNHVVYTKSGTTGRLYVDGVLDKTFTGLLADLGANTADLVICSGGGGSYRFDGIVDEFRIFNRALTLAEIQKNMNVPVTTSTAIAPAAFTITGVKGGLDSIADSTLLDQLNSPNFSWTTSAGARDYTLTVYEDDGTTVKCAAQTIAFPTTNYTYTTGCSLSAAAAYKAKVTATTADGVALNASNSLFRFQTTAVVAPAYALNGMNWNDYVTFASGVDQLIQSDSICVTGGAYGSCVHAGDKRKVATTLTSCASVTATDTLGAFNWICKMISGNAVIFSTGLKDDKRLGHLVDAGGWIDNRVTILQGATQVYQTSLAEWWTNPVAALPANPLTTDAPVRLTAAGTVYRLGASTTTSGYIIEADKISIAMEPGVILKTSGNAAGRCHGNDGSYLNPGSNHVLCIGAEPATGFRRKHVWIEGGFDFQGVSDSAGIIIVETDLSVFRGVNISMPGLNPRFRNKGLRFDMIHMRNDATWGLSFTDDNSGSAISRIHTEQVNAPVVGNGSFSNNVITNVVAIGSQYSAVSISENSSHNSNGNVVSHVSAYGAEGTGVYLRNGTGQVNVSQLWTESCGYHGLWLDAQAAIRASHIAVSSSPEGIRFENVTATNVFSGPIILSNTPINCEYTGTSANTGLADATCANQGSSTATLQTGRPAPLLKGLISTNDLINADDVNGSRLWDLVTDFFRFENVFRYWGTAANGLCETTGTTCIITDKRPLNTDPFIRNRSGDGVTLNPAFVAGASCPSPVSGNTTLTDANGRSYLINASEIFADAVGNDDGLCETNESCIYSPNFGAYQGEGEYLANGTCTFQNGTVSGVTMYAYPTNGATP